MLKMFNNVKSQIKIITRVRQKFSEVVNVFAEECCDGEEVSLCALLLDTQCRKLGTAQEVKGGPKSK